MVTTQEIDQRQKELDDIKANAEKVTGEKIPRRRFGSGVSKAQQQNIVTRRQQATTQIKQVNAEKQRLSKLRAEVVSIQERNKAISDERRDFEIAKKFFQEGKPGFALTNRQRRFLQELKQDNPDIANRFREERQREDEGVGSESGTLTTFQPQRLDPVRSIDTTGGSFTITGPTAFERPVGEAIELAKAERTILALDLGAQKGRTETNVVISPLTRTEVLNFQSLSPRQRKIIRIKEDFKATGRTITADVPGAGSVRDFIGNEFTKDLFGPTVIGTAGRSFTRLESKTNLLGTRPTIGPTLSFIEDILPRSRKDIATEVLIFKGTQSLGVGLLKVKRAVIPQKVTTEFLSSTLGTDRAFLSGTLAEVTQGGRKATVGQLTAVSLEKIGKDKFLFEAVTKGSVSEIRADLVRGGLTTIQKDFTVGTIGRGTITDRTIKLTDIAEIDVKDLTQIKQTSIIKSGRKSTIVKGFGASVKVNEKDLILGVTKRKGSFGQQIGISAKPTIPSQRPIIIQEGKTNVFTLLNKQQTESFNKVLQTQLTGSVFKETQTLTRSPGATSRLLTKTTTKTSQKSLISQSVSIGRVSSKPLISQVSNLSPKSSSRLRLSSAFSQNSRQRLSPASSQSLRSQLKVSQLISQAQRQGLKIRARQRPLSKLTTETRIPIIDIPGGGTPPGLLVAFKLKQRRTKKRKRSSRFRDDIAIVEGITAKALNLKPIKIKRSELSKQAGKFQTVGIRRRVIPI